jgi:hypothetical protein
MITNTITGTPSIHPITYLPITFLLSATSPAMKKSLEARASPKTYGDMPIGRVDAQMEPAGVLVSAPHY